MSRVPARLVRMLRAAPLLVTLLLPPPLAAQDGSDLGRLFFTPERRQSLDRQRALNIQEKQAVPEEPTLTVNGVVTRSGGKRTVWINGVPQDEADRASGIDVMPQTGQPGQVVVRAGESPAARARIGDTVNRTTGQTADLLGDGRIDVRRPPPAAGPR